MKKRILFVDDEPMVTQALQRMLRSMREEWDMEFVDSGAAALRALDAGRFDVIVSDMRMPGMNGAELLAEVMRRHPTTVRLILSGYADKDLILRCVGSTHQYLSKPCDPEALKATIQRVVLSIHAFSQFDDLDMGPLNIEALWSHSLQVAGCAKLIAKAEGSESKLAEEAFAAGLLHDVGKLVLAVNFPRETAEVHRLIDTEGMEPHLAEQSVFAATHADVGGYLIGLWGLPVPVVEAVALHHFPGLSPRPEFSALTCVHVADAIEAGSGHEPNRDYLERIHLASRLPAWREAIHNELYTLNL